MKNILVLGGSGFVGRHVCEALNRAGVHTTVPTRRLPARSVQMLPMVSVVQADVHDPAQLAALLPGHDAVINLIAILHGSEAQFDKAHVQLPTLLVKACLAAGVKRLVHISALGADLNAPSMYQRSKARGEHVLQDHVAQGLALTVLRPSVIFGEDDAFINLFAKLQALAPVVPLAGAHTRFQPVWVCDVAQALLYALQNTSTVGHTYELAGPQIFTLQQLVEHAGVWAQHPRWVIPLPNALAYAQAWLMEHLPGPTLMSRDNVASMQVDNILRGQALGLAALGVPKPATLASVFPLL
ncbi:MAG: complex I NDUFA9 subunit family protein [Betaproteobacteria bacterium]|nr:complex I NDUFA9 subunit family protein [Betaproteobacteria bacterium]NBY34301.1 complex I NDUFA9 subunit family protein [Betaproteobacteria bacterium]